MEGNRIGSLHKVGFKKLTSVEKVWDLIYEHSIKLGAEKIPVTQSIGRINVFKIISSINVPHFNRSAMDGYAIHAEDSFEVSQNNPQILKIIDDIKISEISEKVLGKGEAIKLATGSPIPKGADAVIKIEDTKRTGNEIEIYTTLTPSKNVQRIGEDLKEGDTILEHFHQIRAQDIGMLIACGEKEIEVFIKPTVAIISTGSELIDLLQMNEDQKENFRRFLDQLDDRNITQSLGQIKAVTTDFQVLNFCLY